MANNRMWLVHRPTKVGVLLGKRMVTGWYTSVVNENGWLDNFYDYILDSGHELAHNGGDDFMLFMEDCRYSSCFNDWVYGESFEYQSTTLRHFVVKTITEGGDK